MHVKRRLARRRSLSAAHVKDVARRTHAISKSLKKPVLVMWFCGIPSEIGYGENIPWFTMSPHKLTLKASSGIGPGYRKILVKNNEDFELLRMEDDPKCMLVLDPETILIRDDERFLEQVIEICKSKNWPVEIQGSALAHAFYQLEKEGITTLVSDVPKYKRMRGKKSLP